jgi:hypothetical protein
MLFFRKKYRQLQDSGAHHHDMDHGSGISIKRGMAYSFATVLLIGLVSFFLTHNIQ